MPAGSTAEPVRQEVIELKARAVERRSISCPTVMASGAARLRSGLDILRAPDARDLRRHHKLRARAWHAVQLSWSSALHS